MRRWMKKGANFRHDDALTDKGVMRLAFLLTDL
jgi:hypothetical protein